MRVSPGNSVLAPAIEEERDVRVFLGLGDAQLGQARLRDDLAERVAQSLGREQRGQEAVRARSNIRVRPAAAAKLDDARRGRSRRKPGSSSAARICAHAVGAEIRHQHAVAVGHAAHSRAIDGRRDELVALVRAHRTASTAAAASGAASPSPMTRRVGLLDPVPALVAVHGVIAPADRGDRVRFSAGGVGGELARDSPRASAAACRARRGRHGRATVIPASSSVRRERRDVILVRMHAARRHQAQEMRGAAAFLERGDELVERRFAASAPSATAVSMRGRSCITTRPAPRFMWPTSELPICPLGRPTESSLASMCAWGSAPETVPVGRPGQADGVVGALGALAPAIEDAQHDGTRTMRFGMPAL